MRLVLTDSVQAAYRRDRRLILTAVFLVCVLTWAYTVIAAWQMQSPTRPGALLEPVGQHLSIGHVIMLLVMWKIMMVAMMLPSVMPMLLMYQKTVRGKSGESAASQQSAWFASGYLIIWAMFSVVATAAQWAMHETALMDSQMVTSHTWLGGSILIAAGLYQFTPFKHACLKKCRTPLGFLLNEWREGQTGALQMGLRHGLFCLGCCWALMAVLFAVGVMNLLWIAILTVFVLIEKVTPASAVVPVVSGIALISYGIWLMSGATI